MSRLERYERLWREHPYVMYLACIGAGYLLSLLVRLVLS